MQTRKATLDEIIETTKLVEKHALNNLPIVGLKEPYRSYFYTDNYKNQAKGLFLNGNETKNRNNDIIYIATNTLEKIIGYASGGFSLDNDDYDGEIYTIFAFTSDEDFEIKNLLFRKIIDDLAKMNCRSLHVEITADDLSKNFYIDKGAKFIAEITNMTEPPYRSLDYGWTNIEDIKL